MLKMLMNLCLHQPSRISTADRFRHQGCFFIQKHTHTPFMHIHVLPDAENIFSVTLNDDDTSSAELWLWCNSRINSESCVLNSELWRSYHKESSAVTLLFLDRRLEGPEPQGNYFMLTAQLRPRCEFTNTKCSSGYSSLFSAAGITRGWDALAVWLADDDYHNSTSTQESLRHFAQHRTESWIYQLWWKSHHTFQEVLEVNKQVSHNFLNKPLTRTKRTEQTSRSNYKILVQLLSSRTDSEMSQTLEVDAFRLWLTD